MGSTISQMLPENQAAFLEHVETVRSASKDQESASVAALAASAARVNALHEWVSLTSQTNQMITPLVDNAIFELVIGGEDVSDSTTKVITSLVEKDFEQLQAILRVRAAANLLFGAETGRLYAGDAATVSIMEDLAVSAKSRLENALAD